MAGLILALMVLLLLGLAVLIFVGGRALRADPDPAVSRITAWPPVALLVPVTGGAAGLETRLAALLRQDYPAYRVVFTTRDAADPATAVILSIIPRHPWARHVLAGPARSCGQKNHNLLAALRLVGQTPEILVFCDSNQEAPAGWLKELVAPLVLRQAQVVSGYHQVIPAEPGIAGLGRAVSVLVLYLTKPFRRLNQPWGGATAIRRRLFEDLEVAKLWAENVVDDVSLAARLQRAGLSVALAPAACLYTSLQGESPAGWRDWLTRQWLYLKFCLPASWLAAGLTVHLVAGLMVWAAVQLLLALLGWVSGGQVLAAALFLAGLAGLGYGLRPLHPRSGPLYLWLAAFFSAVIMASWCHLRTLSTREMGWRGITYRVGWRGRVVEIETNKR